MMQNTTNALPNTIIKASAGSGKTFQLSRRYIELICRKVPVKTILASTFTRKAAGEILDRIMSDIGEAAVDDAAFEKLKTGKDENTGELFVPSCPKTREELQTLTAKLAKEIYEMRVSTLDSFFNKIATVFSNELGFAPGWKLAPEEDFEKYLTEAVRNVLDERKNSGIKEILAGFRKGEAARSVTSELVELAKKYISLVRETRDNPKAWEHDFRKPLSEIESLVLRIPQAMQRYDGKDDKRFSKNAAQYLELYQEQNYKKILVKAAELKEKKYTYYGLEFADSDCIEQFALYAFAVEINKLAGMTKAAEMLLQQIEKEYSRIADERRAYQYDDIKEKLCTGRSRHTAKNTGNPVVALSPESLKHRLNSEIHQLMLDEFQDTSMPQWRILEPFVRHADSSRNKQGSVFAVGDMKQAIYGWRGGVAEIFTQVETELEHEKLPLNKSFRSSPVIIDVVNKLFVDNIKAGAGKNAAIDKKDEFGEAVRIWCQNDRLQKHSTAKTDLPGCVSLICSDREDKKTDEENDKEKGKDSDDDFFDGRTTDFSEYVAAQIKKLREDKPDATIGILCGRKKQISKFIESLKKEGIEASDEGGVLLADSYAVQVILSAMKLADHPGDTAAMFHVENCRPLNELLKTESERLNLSDIVRNALITDGYGKTVKKYAAEIAALCNKREFDILQKFVETAYQFDETAAGVRTRDFITLIENKRITSPSAEKVRVMTYFASKGLEFDIVVLPDLHQQFTKGTADYIIARKNPETDAPDKQNNPKDPVKWVLKYAGAEIQAFLPNEYKQAFADRIKNEAVERLSVLYVAMTRPRQELMMLIPANVKADSQTFAGIAMSGLLPKDEKKYEYGNSGWYSEPETQKEFASRRTEERETKTLTHCNLGKSKNQRLVEQIPSKHGNHRQERDTELKPVYSTSSVVKKENPELYGTAVHRCFESVRWLDGEKPDAVALQEAVQQILSENWNKPEAEIVAEGRKIVADFEKLCENETVKRILTKPQNSVCEVETERRFAVRDKEKGRLIYGIIDRLVIHRRNGKVNCLEIIDYKTGSTKPAEYKEQMDAYKRAMYLLYGVDEKAVNAKLLYVEAGVLVQDI